MATKTTKRKTNITKKPGFRLGMIASAIMIVLALIVLSIWFTSKSLFDRNDHFLLKRLRVRSGGWWDKKSNEVSKILDIKKGETNLFSIDLAEKRKILEAEPSISKASISRYLPDTLFVEIMERIPKAYLLHRRSGLLVDNEGIVMSSDSCIRIDRDTPVIVPAERKDLKAGKKLDQLLPALQLLELSSKKVPGVIFDRIDLKYLDRLNFYDCDIKFTNKRKYKLHISPKNLEERLEKLSLILKNIPFDRPNANFINMKLDDGRYPVKYEQKYDR